jgi:ferric-dicitrate binding protein FerR (iron transport regulator)
MVSKILPDGIDITLLTRFFADECTIEEKEYIKSWIYLNKENEKLMSSLKTLWNAAGQEEGNVDTQAAWENVCRKIGLEFRPERNISEFLEHKRISRPLIRRAMAIAAVLLIVIGGYIIFRQVGIYDNSENFQSVWNEKKTVAGEKALIKFPDGTKITLNGNSKLKYSLSDFTSKREVFLDGEAFFEVAHNPERPFVVHCNNIATTVLGTIFNISAYSNDKEIAVSLVEGKVNVTDKEGNKREKKAILLPKQQFLYNTVNKAYNLKEFDVEEITGWKDNLLKFKDETLKNVLVKLERSYGAKFELVPKQFGNYLITTNFQKATLWTVSETIKRLTGLDYTMVKENNQVKTVLFFENNLNK